MKIILDEGVPKQVARILPGHEVMTVPEAGWASVKNGKLLALIEEAGFGAFIANCQRAILHCDTSVRFRRAKKRTSQPPASRVPGQR